MRNPCLECNRLSEDKREGECADCARRWEYVRAMSGASLVDMHVETQREGESMPRGRLNLEERGRIMSMHQAGASVQEIARELKRDKKAVARFLAGVELKKLPEKKVQGAGCRVQGGEETELEVRHEPKHGVGVYVKPLPQKDEEKAPEAGPPARRQFINLPVAVLPDLVRALEAAARVEFRSLTDMALYYIDRGLRSDSYLVD